MNWVRRNPVASTLLAIVILGALDLLLLISGNRVLIGEEHVWNVIAPGSVHAWGITKAITEEQIECRYFTGRSVQAETMPADSIDECPFVINPYRR